MADQAVDVLLVGAGVTSARCARTLRRHGFSGSIQLVGDEPSAPYNRPPLSKELLRDEVPAELILAEPSGWYERHGVALRTGMRVLELDADMRTATLSNGDRIRFERCLLATGAEPRHPPIPGAEHASVLRSVQDAVALRERAQPGARAVVLGGGFIGVEVAASLAARGVAVTLLELTPALWAGSLGPELSAWASRVLAAAGVEVRLSTGASRLEAGAAWVGDEHLAADVLLAGVGVVPRVELAHRAGLNCNDGIVTDAAHATSAPAIWAAGDVARVDGLRVEHWHAAREGGARAALAMLDEALPPRPAPWVYSEFAGQLLDVVGAATPSAETRLFGDAGDERFCVAFIEDGAVSQLAIVNGATDVASARELIGQRPSLDRVEAVLRR